MSFKTVNVCVLSIFVHALMSMTWAKQASIGHEIAFEWYFRDKSLQVHEKRRAH